MSASITVRLNEIIAMQFKEMARNKGLSQAELIEELIKEEIKRIEQQSNSAKGIENIDNKEIRDIKLLLKECNEYKKTHKEAKVYTFKGSFEIGLSQPREVHDFSKDYLKRELSGIDMPCPVGMNGYQTLYQYHVYKREDISEYVIYEYIGVNNLNKKLIEVNIRRMSFAKSMNDILNKLQPYISVAEMEEIEYKLAEDISNSQQEIEEYLNN